MLRSQRGQGSIEYLGIVALVGLLLAAAAAAWTDPAALGRAVPRSLARALCVVSGGFCDVDLRPCVTRTHRRAESWHVNLAVVRLGREEVLLREERSDGTVALTRLRDASGGLDLGVGADGHVTVAGRRLGIGAELRAALLAGLGRGATWVVPAGPPADALETRLRAGGGGLPAPAATYGEWGTRRSYTLTGSAGPVGASGGLDASDADGTLFDPATGRRTVYVRHGAGWTAALLAGPAEADAGLRAQERYGVVFDRRGTARELVVTTGGRLERSLDLPGALAEVAGFLGAAGGRGRLWTAEAHLELTDPVTRRVAAAFVDAVVHPRPHVGAAVAPDAALRELLRERATIEARTYALGVSRDGAGLHAAAGARLGAGYERLEEHSRLLAAVSRGPDRTWRRRDDCMGPLRA